MADAIGPALQSPNMLTQYAQNGNGINPLTGLPYGGSQSSMPAQGIQAGMPQQGYGAVTQQPAFSAQFSQPLGAQYQPQGMMQGMPQNQSQNMQGMQSQQFDPNQRINQLTRYGMGGV